MMMEIRPLGASSTTITIYDMAQNSLVAENLEKLVRKLNTFGIPGARFTSGGFRNNFYLPEIQEFLVVINDKHLLTNEGRFRLNRVYNNETDLEDLARYFLKCLEVGCGMNF